MVLPDGNLEMNIDVKARILQYLFALVDGAKLQSDISDIGVIGDLILASNDLGMDHVTKVFVNMFHNVDNISQSTMDEEDEIGVEGTPKKIA